MDIDATIVIAHSEKEKAGPTWKKTYGFHPLAAFADHGAEAGGEPLAILLRAGNAGSNTATEHIEVTKLALASPSEKWTFWSRTTASTRSARTQRRRAFPGANR